MSTPNSKAKGARARLVGELLQKRAIRGSGKAVVGLRILLNCGKSEPVVAYAWDSAVVGKLLQFQPGESLHIRGELTGYVWTARDGTCDGHSLRLRVTSVAGLHEAEGKHDA